MKKLQKYLQFAKALGMKDAKLLSRKDICYDIRSLLKCRWGCDYSASDVYRCSFRGTTYEERVAMMKKYKKIILVHSNNAGELSKAVLAIEKQAFLDGYYFASAVCCCILCKNCKVEKGEPCPTPSQIRPCELMFGIDMYKTIKKAGLPVHVLQNKDEIPDRYGFVMIE